MKETKPYADITAERITKITDRYGWNSEVSTRYILAQIAVNLALVSDCMLEIYKAERNRKDNVTSD